MTPKTPNTCTICGGDYATCPHYDASLESPALDALIVAAVCPEKTPLVLKPCPFCGSSRVFPDDHVVVCHDCMAQGPIDIVPEQRVAKWNAASDRDDARSVLASLSSWLGSGLGDEGTTAEQYERRIRDGIDTHIGVQSRLMRTDEDKMREGELASVRADNKRMREALEQIEAMEPRPFAGIPSDWQEQVAACEECQRYKGHPIQQGICNEHRQPLWAREDHQRFEEKAMGYRMKELARRALAKEQSHD